jgi:hypothetical protein
VSNLLRDRARRALTHAEHLHVPLDEEIRVCKRTRGTPACPLGRGDPPHQRTRSGSRAADT